MVKMNRTMLVIYIYLDIYLHYRKVSIPIFGDDYKTCTSITDEGAKSYDSLFIGL